MDQAEKLRNIIKSNKQHNMTEARVITVTSGKGGVGKSNTSVNLAVEFAKKGKRVIIIDADFGLANIEVMFGAIPKYNLSDLVYHNKDIASIITSGPNGIGFISGGSGIVSLRKLTSEQINQLIKQFRFLDDMADIIIVDTGAGISDSVLQFAAASPEIIVVATPEPSSLTDSYSLLKALYKRPEFLMKDKRVYLLANKVQSKEDADSVYRKLHTVVTKFLDGDLSYIGMIPYDNYIEKAVRQQKPVTLIYGKSSSAKAYALIAGELLNIIENSRPVQKGITHLFSSLLNRRK